MGSKCLFVTVVQGCRRDPDPPARITPTQFGEDPLKVFDDVKLKIALYEDDMENQNKLFSNVVIARKPRRGDEAIS
jgi:hypothetical protein